MNRPPAPGAILPPLLRGTKGLLLVWLVASLILLAIAAPMLPGMQAKDPDDFMRLLEVRDWLSGQSWWDVRQHRMLPPLGADMHWSRLVDLPIAATLLVFRLFLAEPAASTAAMALVPLIELLVAMALIRRLLLALGEREAVALGGAALVPLFPVLTSNFLPLRIDHHGWQAILALACMLATRERTRRGAAIAGLLAGLWLTISLEGLMLVAALCALLAWRYVATRERALSPFLGAAAVSMTLLFLATRPLSWLAQPTVDAVSWPHIAAFAAAALLTALAPRLPGQRGPTGRALALAPAALAGAAIILAGLGPAAADPFSRMDPIVRRWWFDYIPEGLPITAQDASTTLMLLWTPGLVAAGWLTLRSIRPATAARWNEPVAMALIAALLSLVVMRTCVAAQLLCVPLSAVMIARALPSLRASRLMVVRVAGTVLCLVTLTPSLASGLGKHLPVGAPATSARPSSAGSAPCRLETLNRLPRSHIFTTLGLGPEILVRTPHSVVIGSYHRNDAAMRQVIEAFSGDPRTAEGIVRGQHAAYVVLCDSDPESHVMASRRGDALAGALLAGHGPGWLEAVQGFDGALKVFRVRH
ncbi:hypothetical protein [Novosphingobium rosa]|uniref:hypothetical protein n=1 Tax=Novosphingobium rosa TaxID=76978 RepID=UPI0008323D58|nr:hypothetical protein [Novosphingobium rosa]